MKLLPSGPRRATRNSSGDAAGTGRSAASSTAGAACTVSDVDSDTSDTSDTNSNQLQAMATISDSAMEAIRFFFAFFLLGTMLFDFSKRSDLRPSATMGHRKKRRLLIGPLKDQ